MLALIDLDPGFPSMTYDNNGTTAYNAATDAFSVNARPLQFNLNGIDPFDLVTAPKSVAINIVVNSSGALVGGSAGDDLVITGVIDVDGDTIPDYSGTLLTGEILAFGFVSQGGGDATFDFLFEATGGQLTVPTPLSGGGNLPNFYAGKKIYMTQNMENVVPFNGFETDFSGNAKGTEGPVNAAIEIEKTVVHECEGVFDDSGEPLPLFDVTAGPVTVTYNYAVTNTGTVDLYLDPTDANTLVDVNDNGSGPDINLSLFDGTIVAVLAGGFNVGDLNQNGKIDGSDDGMSGETWQFTADVQLENGGFNENTATVIAEPVTEDPEEIISLEPVLGTVTASDDFVVYLAVSGVAIEKRVNGEDANDPPFDHVLAGSLVSYSYFVTNTGNVDLDIAQAILDGTFIDDGGPDYPDFTPTSVVGMDGFNIGDTNKNGILDAGPNFVGESWQFERVNVQLNNVGLYTNNVQITVSPLDEAEEPIDEECLVPATAEDPANIIVDLPSVTLVKEVDDPECIANIDGQGDVPLYEPDDVVPYKYTIDNIGTTALIVTLIDVTDNGTPVDTGDDISRDLIIDGVAQAGVIISGDDGDNLLETDEVWVVSFSTTLTALGYNTNQGFLTATPADSEGEELPGFSNLEEFDNAVVYIGVTGIQIEKRVNSQDANTEPPAFPTVLPGGTVNYSYLVTNTGNVILEYTSFLDDGGGVGVPFTPSAVLKPNGKNIGDANNNNKFDPGESWEYEKLGVVINAANTAPDLFINTATVQATPVEFDGTPIDEDCLPSVQDSDIATVRLGEPLSSLSGYVWEDCDDDGVFDADEFGIGGVTIQLFVLQNAVYVPYAANPDELTSNVPGMLGYYEFTDLPPGTYQIFEVQPVGFFDGQDTIGPPNNTPPGVVITNDQYSNIVVPSGVDYASFNFGEIEPSSISGCVYIDTNNNGVKDPGELAIQGVTIYLTGTDYRGNAIDQQDVSDANGLFSFTNLPPAKKQADGGLGYTLTQGDEADALFIDGKDHAGTAGGIADGPPPDNDQITGIFLEGCFDATDYCFGEFGLKIPSKRPFIFTDGEWQNRTNPFDVTRDGCVDKEDLLVVIDSLNRTGTKQLSGTNSTGACPDVDGDSYLGIKDALALIDVLNRDAAAATTAATTSSTTSSNETSGGLLAFAASSDGDSSESSGPATVQASSSTVTTSSGSSNSGSQATPTLTSEELLELAYGLALSSSESSVDVNELYDAVYASID